MSGPRAWLRRAGYLDAGGGETVLWSVAEGSRGRRWRSLRRDGAGQVRSDLLLEVDPGGRWARLELATRAGILTLHPEPDGESVHGNVVTPEGVVPLAFPWSAQHVLVLPDEPIAAAALGRPAGTAPSPGLVIRGDLAVRRSPDAVLPPPPDDGLPGPSWPLEP